MLETLLPNFKRMKCYDTLCKAQNIFNEEQFTEYLCKPTTQYSGAIVTRFGVNERLAVHDTEGCVLEVVPDYRHGLFWWKEVAVRLEPQEEGIELNGVTADLANFLETATGYQTTSSSRFIYLTFLVKPRTLVRYRNLFNYLDSFQQTIESYVKPLVDMYAEKSKDAQALMSEHDI